MPFYRACWIDPDSKKRPPVPGHYHDGTLGSRQCSEAQPDHRSVAGCYITPPTPARARALLERRVLEERCTWLVRVVYRRP
jgi:hypothetical protein